MSRSARLFDLLQALRRRRRPVSADVLGQELGVSKRTIYRDIEILIAQGAPIDGEAGVGFVMRPGFTLPPLMFTEAELEALTLGARWVAGRGDRDLVAAAQDALAKIAAVLPDALTATLENPALTVAPAWRVAAAEVVDPAALRQAIRRERKIRIAYADDRGTRTDRIVWPLTLIQFESARLLVAWCELRADFRHFRADRIVGLETLDDRYPKPRQALIRAWSTQDAERARHHRPADDAC